MLGWVELWLSRGCDNFPFSGCGLQINSRHWTMELLFLRSGSAGLTDWQGVEWQTRAALPLNCPWDGSLDTSGTAAPLNHKKLQTRLLLCASLSGGQSAWLTEGFHLGLENRCKFKELSDTPAWAALHTSPAERQHRAVYCTWAPSAPRRASDRFTCILTVSRFTARQRTAGLYYRCSVVTSISDF